MAGFVELIIEQGTTYSTYVTVKDANGLVSDLTGYTASAQIRKSYYSSSYTSFTVTIPSPATGNISMAMSASTTANIAPGRYVFDLKMESPSNTVTRVVEGIISVTPGVSR